MRRPVLILTFLLAVAACGKENSSPPNVIARIGDRTATLENFKHYLTRNAGLELVQVAPEAASALLDQFAEEALLSAYAGSHEMDVSAEQVAQAVRRDAGSTVLEKRDQMRRQRLVAEIGSRIKPPTDDEVREYYDQHQGEFSLGERVRARQILVHDQRLAAEIRDKLVAGGSFDELSKKHSSAPNADQGGDIGYIGRGQLPKLFEDELFGLQPGGVSRAIQADSTWHIFRVEDLRPAGPLDFASAAPLIRTRMSEDAMNRELSRVLAKAREEVEVTILTKRLPFVYTGVFPKAETE
jgi:parvulin-like peptidyl-prolyl isomerase